MDERVVLETRQTVISGEVAYVVSVVDGPRDLLARGTEAAALEDGQAHVQRYWERTTEGWKARACPA